MAPASPSSAPTQDDGREQPAVAGRRRVPRPVPSPSPCDAPARHQARRRDHDDPGDAGHEGEPDADRPDVASIISRPGRSAGLTRPGYCAV